MQRERSVSNGVLLTQPWSLEWSQDGQLLGSIAKDKHLHILDPRSSRQAAQVSTQHEGSCPQRLQWLGDTGKILTVGSNARDDGRYYAIFDTRHLGQGPLVRNRLDNYTCDVHLHLEPANNILFVENRGHTSCEYFKLTDDDHLSFLNRYVGA